MPSLIHNFRADRSCFRPATEPCPSPPVTTHAQAPEYSSNWGLFLNLRWTGCTACSSYVNIQLTRMILGVDGTPKGGWCRYGTRPPPLPQMTTPSRARWWESCVTTPSATRTAPTMARLTARTAASPGAPPLSTTTATSTATAGATACTTVSVAGAGFAPVSLAAPLGSVTERFRLGP